jgi:RHS repeat-associated protein
VPGGGIITGGDGCSVAMTQARAVYGDDARYFTGCYKTSSGAAIAGFYALIDPNTGQYTTYRGGGATLQCSYPETYIDGSCKRPKSENEEQCYGNPLDVLSGYKKESAVDFDFFTTDEFRIERFYSRNGVSNILSSNDGVLGEGWRTGFEAKFSYDLQNRVYVTLPTGKELVFALASGTWASGTWAPAYVNSAGNSFDAGRLGVRETFVRNGANFELTTAEGVTYVFAESNSRLITIRKRGGYVQTLTYDSNGVNTGVTDNRGRAVSFVYDQQRHLSEVKVNGTTVVKYEYLGRVDTALLAPYYGGTVPPDVAQGVAVLEKAIFPPQANATITYHYEDTTNKYALTGITDERGIRYATWGYDAQGRATSSVHAGSVDQYTVAYGSGTATVTNPLGKDEVVTYSTTSQGNQLVSSLVEQPSTNCPLSNTTRTYDANNFRASVTDAESRVTTFVNDAIGQPTSITRGSGTAGAVTSSISWNATWRMPSQIVDPGLTTDYVWNSSGQLTSVTQTDTTSQTVPYATSGQTRVWTYTYGTNGMLASVDGPLSGTGDTVSFTYDALGFVQTITNEIGHVTTVDTVNDRGQPTLVTDPNGIKTALTYDGRGWLKTVTADSTGTPATTSIDYTAVGQIAKVTLPDASWQSFTYDNARRLTTVTNNAGETTNYVRDAMGGATSITRKKADTTTTFARTQTFDELGRLLKAIGANSSTWQFGYDRTDNLTAVTDPRSNVFGYGFDALNRLISETDEENQKAEVTRNGIDRIASYKDARTITTTYVRNGFGEIIQSASPDSGTTVFQRDARGLITQKTDGRSVVTNQTFDNAGRILTRTFPSETSLNVTWTYDAVTGGNKGKGRLTSMTDASGTTAWIYDARGNVLSETRVIGGKTYVVSYAYNLADKVTQITYPSGRIVDVSRDATGRVGGVTTKQNATATSATLASGVVYQPFGDLQSLTYGNGLSLWRTFTADDQLNQLLVENTTTSVATIKRFHDRTDNGLNLTSIATYDDVSPPPSQSFWYSPARRLQDASGAWGSLTYYYGSGGNRTHEILTSGGTTTTKITSYASTSNRMTQVTTNGTVSRTFAHDNAGNLVTDTKSGTAWTYTHNAAGRLSQASEGATIRGTYTYDGLERLAIRAAAATTHLIYDTAGHLLAEADGSTGATVREYVWLEVDDLGAATGPTKRPANDNDRSGSGGKLGAAENADDPTAPAQLPSLNMPKRGIASRAVPLAVVADMNTASPTTLYVHADHLDRPVRMTDASKALVWDAVYKPYGEVQAITGSAALDARFPGQWFQLETGLHYNWHRHYDPTTGRYLEPDPLGFVDGPSVYAYALNSPQMWVDREGTEIKFLGPSQGLLIGGDGRICGVICGNYGIRLDYGPNPSGSNLHIHCGPLDQKYWGGHRPWYAPWKAY